MGTDDLIGRGALLATLSDTFACAAHDGQALLLLGESGIGKTAGLGAAGSMARVGGHQVLETAGNQAEMSLPFAGLQRLLRPLLAVTEALPDVQRRALLTAFGMDDAARTDRFVVSVATLSLLRAAAEVRALVIIADDVQWLDNETQHVLAFVARRIDGERVMMVAASSVQDLPDLRDAFRVLRLDRLNEEASHCLLARLHPDLKLARREWVVARALGNPLALVELAKTPGIIDETQTDPASPALALTPTLERAFAGRWHELAPLAKDAVLVAAVASDASLPEILAATGRLSGQAVTASVLERPQSLGMLSFDETRVHFVHPLARTAIVQKESVARRQAAHRALGTVITVHSRRRAWHRALGAVAHDDAIAAELEATTADSVQRGETATAIAALERAAELSTAPNEQGRRILLGARYAFRIGQVDLTTRLLGAALSGELSEFERTRAELLRDDLEGIFAADSNRIIQLCAVAGRAAAAGETDLALDVAYAASRRRCAAPLSARARSDLSFIARGLARDSRDARAIAVLALVDPIGHGRAVLSALEDIDETTVIDGDSLSAYAVAARAVGHYTCALRLFDRADIALRAGGLLGPLARNLCVAAELRLELGEWDRATDALIEFTTLSAASMSASHRAAALAATAKASALRGNADGALKLVAATEHSPEARGGSRFLAQAQIVRGIGYLSMGKHLDAYLALSRVFTPEDPSHHFREQYGAIAYLAEAAIHSRNQDHAGDVVERMQTVADTSGAPLLAMHLAYARAVLAPDDAAEQLFLAGLASDATDAPWPRARLQLAYGRWLRRQQRVTESRQPLQTSLETFQRIGATRWAAEASDELAASGARVAVQTDDSTFDLLSVQESKIARLVIEGLSNREIGQQLYLSPRTVSSHLYRIFPKLGITSRGQLASRLSTEHALPTS